jgi:glycosyltransferase involved in cell wall biosynthesis
MDEHFVSEVFREMNLVFVWSGLAGYMGDAWRALARLPDVRLKVFNEEPMDGMTRFDPDDTLRGLDFRLIYENEEGEAVARLMDEGAAFRPDAIFIVGWHRRLSRRFALNRRLNHVPKVLILDLPFAFTLKKLVAPIVLRPYLRRFAGCFVPRTSAVRYARWLGFKGGVDGKTHGGWGWVDDRFESVNVRKFDGIAQQRKALPEWPRKFLYVGRYAQEKGLDKLIAAYRRYRAQVAGEPWGLDCCGAGPLAGLFRDQAGVRDLGFSQPDAIPEVMLGHGAFVIASLHEPWGAVIAEAAAAGLPVICTEACGAATELVKGNGIVCKTGDAEDMARAMLRVHRMSDAERAKMGAAGMPLAEPYSSERWAEAVFEIAKRSQRRG